MLTWRTGCVCARARVHFAQAMEGEDEAAVAVDALVLGRRAPTFTLPEPGVESYVVVPRPAFDEDLLRSFPGRDVRRAVRSQVLIDAPRCDVEVEGVRVNETIPPGLEDVATLALCTQAVVGLAVELLHRSVGLVMEPPRRHGGGRGEAERLSIRVSLSGDFSARKRLVVYRSDGTQVPILLLVVGGGEDVCMHVIP